MNYISFNDFALSKFGCKVYKLSIEGGTTCPNRDGRCGVGGCIFCNGGSGSFAESGGSVAEQLENAKRRVEAKCKSGKYIAYFQSYTATYLPLGVLKKKLYDAVSLPYIVGVSVATRPDCLEEDKLELLGKINRIKPVIVELGLQTASDTTALYINRGYPLEVYDNAVKSLKALGIHIVTHLIFGLPGESREAMLDSVRYVSNRTDGVKLQMLHILKGTMLERIYNDDGVSLMSLEEYADIICESLMILPHGTVIHRITGDGDKKCLVAPLWTADKKRVLNYLSKRISDM